MLPLSMLTISGAFVIITRFTGNPDGRVANLPHVLFSSYFQGEFAAKLVFSRSFAQ